MKIKKTKIIPQKSWQTFGHQGVKKLLDQQLAADKIGHAYLFSGPPGVGKKTLALEFAQKILQTENLQNHPDFKILDSSSEILVENTRDFISFLSFKPFFGNRKVAVINEAENLNAQSSNALLKTLEEPSPSSVIILIAQGQLLPTIVSRCLMLNFNSFSNQQLADFALKAGLVVSKKTIALSFGSVGALKLYSDNKSSFDKKEQAVEAFEQLGSASVAEKLLTVSDLGNLEIEDLKTLFLTWYFWQAENLAEQPQKFIAVGALNEAILNLKKNMNKKLVLQRLMLKI